MDATSLRWVLGIIGVLFIAGIYLFSVYQSKLRRQASVETFTREEMESGFIEDEALRQELSNINSMLDEQVNDSEIQDIKINPGLEVESKAEYSSTKKNELLEIELPRMVCELLPDYRIAHVLKPLDDRLLTAQELRNALTHAGFVLNADNRYILEENPDAQFQILNLTAAGSFQDIDKEQFTTRGLVCCINLSECTAPLSCYEILLKKIDELVRILDLKVYNHELDLLTLQHVTEVRNRLSEKLSSNSSVEKTEEGELSGDE